MKLDIPIKGPSRNLTNTMDTSVCEFTRVGVLILPTVLNLPLTLICSLTPGLSVTLALTLTSNTTPFLNSNTYP